MRKAPSAGVDRLTGTSLIASTDSQGSEQAWAMRLQQILTVLPGHCRLQGTRKGARASSRQSAQQCGSRHTPQMAMQGTREEGSPHRPGMLRGSSGLPASEGPDQGRHPAQPPLQKLFRQAEAKTTTSAPVHGCARGA